MAKAKNKIFDEVFKALMQLSDLAVISFINALFDTTHPPDSQVIRRNTEFPKRGGGKLFTDMVITIVSPGSQDTGTYLIECQIDDDDTMAFRVFEYAFAYGKQDLQKQDGIITLRFPQVRVIYLEPTPHTPDVQTLRLEFPDGHWDYPVKTIKVLDHSIPELMDRNLGLLLPFYVLKIRKRLHQTKNPAKRQQLAEELTAINKELAAAFKRSEAEGSITDADRQKLFDMTEQLYDHLYLGYTEFKEAHMVLDLTRLEKIDALYDELKTAREEKQEALRRAEQEKQEMARRIRELEEQLSRKG
ncbi:hypothetical protein LQZ19_11815 [Treponema primitia]|uniref:hypothetical protein n=1 Tax=Treponema primitia TaxID=88058 RepID=UPI00397FAC6C